MIDHLLYSAKKNHVASMSFPSYKRTDNEVLQGRILSSGCFLEWAPGTLIITWGPSNNLKFDPCLASVFYMNEP